VPLRPGAKIKERLDAGEDRRDESQDPSDDREGPVRSFGLPDADGGRAGQPRQDGRGHADREARVLGSPGGLLVDVAPPGHVELPAQKQLVHHLGLEHLLCPGLLAPVRRSLVGHAAAAGTVRCI
jgi:hypothetical protein